MRSRGALLGGVDSLFIIADFLSTDCVGGIDWIFAHERYNCSRWLLILADGAIGGVDFTSEERKRIAAA